MLIRTRGFCYAGRSSPGERYVVGDERNHPQDESDIQERTDTNPGWDRPSSLLPHRLPLDRSRRREKAGQAGVG